MRYHYIPGQSPLTPDDQRPHPLQGTPPAGSSGAQPARPLLPENATRVERLIHELGSDDWTVCTNAQSELARIGTDPVDILCDVLRTGTWNVRWRAAWVLGRIADISAVPPLCEALKDKYGYSWEANLQSFAQVDRTDGRALVPTASREQRALLRMEAAEALGRIGEPEAIPVLCAALWDGYEQVRERASLALAQIGVPALDAVIEVVEGSGTEARVWAVRALGQIGTPTAIPVLVGVLDDRYAGLRVASAEALTQLAPRYPVLELRPAVPILRRLLSRWSLRGNDVVYAAALAAIEQSTAALRNLPLPSGSAGTAAEALPLPAQPHAAEAHQLPRPSDRAAHPAASTESPGAVRRLARWLRERLQ